MRGRNSKWGKWLYALGIARMDVISLIKRMKSWNVSGMNIISNWNRRSASK